MDRNKLEPFSKLVNSIIDILQGVTISTAISALEYAKGQILSTSIVN